jgi:hypothetical protein
MENIMEKPLALMLLTFWCSEMGNKVSKPVV